MNVGVEFLGERSGVPAGCPEFQLGVAPGRHAHGQCVVGLPDPQSANRLHMAAVQAFGEPDEGAEQLHAAATRLGQGAVALV